MLSRSLQLNWWRSIRRWLVGQTRRADLRACCQRLTLHENDAFTVPTGTRQLRVVSGGAWVSHRREDIIVQTGQVLHLRPEVKGVVVTSLGRQPLELEICC